MDYSHWLFDKFSITKLHNAFKGYFPVKGIKPVTSYRYSKPICRSVYNYNSVSRNIQLSSSCDCANSQFCNPDHGHVITGNMAIFAEYNLDEVVKHGTNFRVSKVNNPALVFHVFKKNINAFILKIAVKYNYTTMAFQEWREFILGNAYDIIYRQEYVKPVVKVSEHKNDIERLHDKYVVTYVDKVASNFAVTCKAYYCELLETTYSNDLVFQKCNSPISIKNRISAFYRKLKLNITTFKCPYLIMIPKFHKHPLKFRSITVGCNTYMKSANVALFKVLSYVMNVVEKDHVSLIVNNSYAVVNNVKKMDNINDMLSLDFMDLFNSIELEDLMHVMLNLFEEYDLSKIITIAMYTNLLTFL